MRPWRKPKVAATLGPMMESSDATARLEPLDDRLRVEVRSGSGALLVVRDLALGPSCDDLAAAAAVVIATAVGSAPETEVCRWSHRFRFSSTAQAESARADAPGFAALAGSWCIGGNRSGAAAAWWWRAVAVHRTVPAAEPARKSLRAAVPAGRHFAQAACAGQGLADWTRLELSLGPRLRLSRGLLLCDLFLALTPALVLASGRELPQTFRAPALTWASAVAASWGRGSDRCFRLWRCRRPAM